MQMFQDSAYCSSSEVQNFSSKQILLVKTVLVLGVIKVVNIQTIKYLLLWYKVQSTNYDYNIVGATDSSHTHIAEFAT